MLLLSGQKHPEPDKPPAVMPASRPVLRAAPYKVRRETFSFSCTNTIGPLDGRGGVNIIIIQQARPSAGSRKFVQPDGYVPEAADTAAGPVNRAYPAAVCAVPRFRRLLLADTKITNPVFSNRLTVKKKKKKIQLIFPFRLPRQHLTINFTFETLVYSIIQGRPNCFLVTIY